MRINLAVAKAYLTMVYVVGTAKVAVQKKVRLIESLCTLAI